ncbi:ATP-dependent DNA ligase Cdc17 [Coemansia javaensis]|uniref:DNA ligase 1 n=1 Tax=Coemansia javaensis TaxID=2761396 RepID=A0A9W8HJA2_9FUNG|nr:ATP-dependent DNA ligase Cdc17 [Coemansia javaensis]
MKQSMIASFFGGGAGKSKPAAGAKEKDASGSAEAAKPEEPAAAAAAADGSATEGAAADAPGGMAEDPAEDLAAAAPSGGQRRGFKRQAVSSDESDGSTCLDGEEGGASDSDSEVPEAKPPAAAKPAAKKAKTKGKDGDRMVAMPTGSIELIDTKDGPQVPFRALCEVFEQVEATTKRLEITALVRDFLFLVMKAGPEHLKHTVMVCINKVAPDHEGIELGIGESALIKAIATATGRQAARIKQEHQELGDLGAVAQRSKTSQRTMFKPKPLSVSRVLATFKEIAQTSGSSAIQKKVGLISDLLAACSSSSEAKYLIRALEGRLRIGLAESTVQAALAQAALLYERGSDDGLEPEDLQKATDNLKQVLSQFPVYENVIAAIYEHGISGVASHCMLTPTLPVKPMLAKIEKAADDILRRFEGRPFTCEYKYDGERSQIHYVRDEAGGERCVVFSRNAENNTAKYPDIAASVREFARPDVTSFILDCEAVAWDQASGRIRSFQVLSSRRKKVDDQSEITVGVCCFSFDLLFLNGEPLIKLPLRRRRELLREHFVPVANKFQYATSRDLTEVEDIQEFLEQSIVDNCEGLMIKTLDGEMSSYEPSKRSLNWLKLKKDYVDGLGDSLDLVVIGAYYGKGKRVGAYGAYLLACYDPDREEYQAICKIGTGFSDSDLEAHKAKLDQSRIEQPKPYYAVSDKTKPDIWFEPAQVWEVKAADLSLSPIYQAAYGEAMSALAHMPVPIDATKGVSLRFPRFIRVRDDKTAEMATSSAQVAEMYENQKTVQ